MNDTLVTLAEDAVVLFVDQQRGIADSAKTQDGKQVDKTAAALATAAKLYDIPIVVSAIKMGGEPQLTAKLRDVLDDHYPVHVRGGSNSFDDPAIVAAIERTGRKTVLLSGVLTEIAVERPALTGAARGYRMQVVVDACNGRNERSEQAALIAMSHAKVRLTSLASVVGELATDFEDPRALKVMALLAT